MLYNIIIELKAGDGGSGKLSFYRSKRSSKGGPDGGNGGNGADIIFQSSIHDQTLNKFAYQKHIKSLAGIAGSSGNKHGANQQARIVTVPAGTQIFLDNQLVANFDKPNMSFLAAQAGKGGKGNTHYKTATDQAPIEYELGSSGERKTYRLILKHIADIGIIGLPNAGKSSLLNAISNAKPKIANYPFTTIKPQLGTVFHKNQKITFIDIPGLIEGAHNNRGLGHEFLSHIERCKVLVHLIDCTQNIQDSYQIIRNELALYSPVLAAKPEIIVINKCDLMTSHNVIDSVKDLHISAAQNINLDKLIELCAQQLAATIDTSIDYEL